MAKASKTLRVGVDAPLVQAAKILETYRISSLPAVDNHRLVGILSVTDLLRVFVEQNTEIAA